MAWTTPGTAVAGNVLTAALWNSDVRDNSAAIRASQINVQSTTKTDVFTSTSTSLVDITGLSVTITPSSATSKVLVLVSLSIIATSSGGNYMQRGAILRGSTVIGGGAPSSLRPAGSFASLVNTAYGFAPFAMTHLDSPATTSATTYKVQAGSEAGGGAGFAINRSFYSDPDNAGYPRLASSITVIEVPV